MSFWEEVREEMTAYIQSKSDPFCSQCDCIVTSIGRKANGYAQCLTCGSDDLMYHLSGVGVSWFTDEIAKSLIEEECESVDVEERFAEFMNEICNDVKVFGYYFDACTILKELSPTTWRCEFADWISRELEETLVEIGNHYYKQQEIRELIA